MTKNLLFLIFFTLFAFSCAQNGELKNTQDNEKKTEKQRSMENKIKENVINIGTGKDYTIKQYVKMILNILIPNKKIKIKYDLTKPNGTPKKVLDISLAKKYGWKPKSKFNQAVMSTYKDFLGKKT